MGMPRPPLRDAASGADRRPSPGRGPGRRGDHPRAPSRRALGADRRAAPLPAVRGRGADAFGARGVLLGDPAPGRGCPRCPRTRRSGRAGTTRPSGRGTPSAATSRRTDSSSTRRSASRRLLRARQGGPTVLVHPDDAARPGDRRGRPRCRLQRPGAGALHRGPVRRHAARPGGHRGDLVAQVHAGRAGRQRPDLGRSGRHGRGARRSTRRWWTWDGPTPRRRRSPATPSVRRGRPGRTRPARTEASARTPSEIRCRGSRRVKILITWIKWHEISSARAGSRPGGFSRRTGCGVFECDGRPDVRGADV